MKYKNIKVKIYQRELLDKIRNGEGKIFVPLKIKKQLFFILTYYFL